MVRHLPFSYPFDGSLEFPTETLLAVHSHTHYGADIANPERIMNNLREIFHNTKLWVFTYIITLSFTSTGLDNIAEYPSR